MKRKKITMLLLAAILCIGSHPVSAKADGNIAFSVGKQYEGTSGLSVIDTRNDAWDAWGHYCDCGYESLIEVEPTKGNVNNARRLKADILFFSGHGNNVEMDFETFCLSSSDLRAIDSNDIDLKKHYPSVKLVTFGGCKTAEGTNNLTYNAVACGAQTAVGWSTTVYPGSHSNWLCRYNNALAEGYTVTDAANAANSYIYLPGSGVTHVVIAGNGNLIIGNNMASSVSARQGSSCDRRMSKYFETVSYSGKKDIWRIEKEIQKMEQSFSLENYKVYEYDRKEGNYVLNFVRLVDGYETLTGYTAIISDGFLNILYDNTDPKLTENEIQEITENLQKYPVSEREIFLKYSLKENSANVDYHYIYDINTGKKYLVVFSEYIGEEYSEKKSLFYEIEEEIIY